jgi:hypothetical protein
MTLRKFYRIAVLCFFLTITVGVILNIVLAIVGREPLENLPFLVRLPLGMLGACGAIGIIALWIGMMWNCVANSQLSMVSKIGWLLLIVLTNMLGAVIYYYVVFQRPGKSLARDGVAAA